MKYHKFDIERIKRVGAIWEYKQGDKYHISRSGESVHTDIYLNSDKIVSHPALVESIALEFFIPVIQKRGIKPDWVITYPPFGIPLAYELASKAKCKFGYVYNLSDEICYFDIRPQESVIIVADDIYSGISIKRTIAALNKKKVKHNFILSIANFLGEDSIENIELISLINKKANFWYYKNCPLCRAGSKAIVARKCWENLIPTSQY